MEKKTIDLSEFVSQDNAESGVWIPFDIDGKQTGVQICVLGADSDPVQMYSKRAEKKLQKMMKNVFAPSKISDDDFNEDEAHEEIKDKIESAVVRINGIKGIKGEVVTVNGRDIGQDKESYRYFCDKIRSAVDWVIGKSTNRSLFFSGRKKS